MVAIIGAGAAGTLTTINLLHALAGTPCRIVLLDRLARHGRGTAYATTDDRHLLNVPAGRMSAFPEDPGHFVRWARASGTGVAGDTYAPRRLYGEYLTAMLAAARSGAARTGGPDVTPITATATAITETDARAPMRVHLAAGGRIDADLVVLALGNRPPADPVPGLRWSARYVADPWHPGALHRPGGRVLCVGTGLTMIDVALTLARDPSTTVYALSRHGLLPQSHDTAVCSASADPVAAPEQGDGPLRLVDAMAWVNRLVARCPDWRQAMELIRPHVADLWSRMPDADRRVFTRRLARYWEVHRHRMPETTTARVDALRRAGRLRLITGTVLTADPYRDGIEVEVATADGPRRLAMDWLVNCTGPGERVPVVPPVASYGAERRHDAVFAQLAASGLARPGPLGVGLDTSPDGALLTADGVPHPRLFTLGPPRRGTLYESTAIPEIRHQARALARHLATLIPRPTPLVDAVLAAGRRDAALTR